LDEELLTIWRTCVSPLKTALFLLYLLCPLPASAGDIGTDAIDKLASDLAASAGTAEFKGPLRVFVRPTSVRNSESALQDAQDLSGSLAALDQRFEVLERSEQAMLDGMREQAYNIREAVDKSTALAMRLR
jgi:hypothetical protein